MADDRTRAHAAAGPDEEIHDDDELAAALAAELDRIAPTGAVPVLRASAVPFGPVRPEATPPAQPVENRPSAGRQPVVAGPAQPSSVRRSAEPEGSATPSRRVASTAPERQGPPNEGDRPEALAPRSARRHAPSATPEAATPEPHHRHVETSARHSDREARGARLQAVPAGSGAAQGTPVEADVPLAPPPPVRATRAPSFSTTAEPRPEPAPGRRRAADPEPPSTQPVVIPEAVRPISESALPPPPDLQDPLRETGPLALPPTLYDSWEQSLRSIGRPRSDDWLDSTVADHSDADAATISLSRAALGPLPEPPAREPAAEIVTPAAEEAATVPEPRRRGRAGRAARVELPGAAPEPVAGPVPAVAAATTVSHTDPPVVDSPPLAEEESDGVDEVDTGIRAVSAADTASVPLPPMIEQAAPVSGAIPVVVPRDTTEAKGERRVPLGGASLLALLLVWCGALASPALFLAGFGLAAGGGGGAAAGALVLGVALALPAAVRLTAASDADRAGSPAIASRVFGPRGGPAVAAVLLAARLLAAVLALLGVADLAAAFTARTGVGGTSSSAASVTAVLVAGLAALLAVAWPRRTTRIVLGVLAVLALLVAVIVLVVTAPAVATAVPTAPPAVSTVTGGAVGFAVPGLLLTATVADATLLAAGRRRGRGAAVAIVLAAIVGLVILVLALAVGRGAGASGDGATAFAGVVADATPASAAVPLGVALLVAALPLPALLLATSGDAAAVLIGAGRSARLGSVAAGLLVLAVTLALFAVGLTAPSALATLGPVLGVPVAVWTGVVTLAPLRSPATRSVRATAFVAAAIATVIGWLLVDGLLVPGERSPVLDLLRIPLGSAWRGGPALGVLVAFVLGLLAAVLARAAASRAAAPPASRLRSSGGQAVDSVEG